MIAVLHGLIAAALMDPHAALADYEAAARRAGLAVDRACYARSLREDEATPVEWPVPREITRCGECPILLGALRVGQRCRQQPGGSDCARGLVCAGHPDGRCVDPCAPTPPGARCYLYETGCAPGWFCDPWLERCRRGAWIRGPGAGPHEGCLRSAAED